MFPRLVIENFGPFEKINLELKPLTLFIGRNSVGKSMLLYLLWTLSSSFPDMRKIVQIFERDDGKVLVEDILNKVCNSEDIDNEFKNLLKLIVKELPHAVASTLEYSLIKTFNVNDLRELSNDSSREIVIDIVGEFIRIIFKIYDRVIVDHYEINVKPLEDIHVKTVGKNYIVLSIGDVEGPPRPIFTWLDLLNIIVDILVAYVYTGIHMFFTHRAASAIFVDSRAGIIRTLLRTIPYQLPRIATEVVNPDISFIELYYSLIEDIRRGKNIDLEFIKPFLREIGIENIELLLERGAYTIILTSWTGKKMRIEDSPSGVREALLLALSLATREYPWVIYVEEPEAHLHPKAQIMLARLIVRSINRHYKRIILTTHSDYIITTINNLISLSSESDEKLRELGYTREDIIEPDNVAAYLIRPEGRKAVVEKLEVTSDGIPEDEFAKIAMEILDERTRIYA